MENTKINMETNDATLRYLNSIEFNIVTASIMELEEKIIKWTKYGNCGSIIYGRSRLGKTRAIIYITQHLKEIYGEEFPILFWSITDHAVTERNFYLSALMMFDDGETLPKTQTAVLLKQKILNRLIMLANDTTHRRIVLFIDEAYLMTEKDFKWLMDLYNNLNIRNIQLITFLFGTQELKDLKKNFMSHNLEQIISRFMINEYQFKGISSAEEMQMCLISIDNTNAHDTCLGDTGISLKKTYFPYAEDDQTFQSLSGILWDSFQEIIVKHKLKSKDIPMKYFIDTIQALLDMYGQFSDNSVVFPSKANLTSAIMETGFSSSVGVNE